MAEQKDPENEEMNKESGIRGRMCSNVNWTYLPIKAHYFFMFGGIGGAMPYIQVLAKDFGISPTAVGIIYTLVPLCVFLAKPAFGFLTDKLRNLKAIILVVLLITAFSYYAILYVPSIKYAKLRDTEVTAMCKDNLKDLIFTSITYNPSCAKEIMTKQFDCQLTSNSCLEKEHQEGTLNITGTSSSENISMVLTFNLQNKYLNNQICDCLKHNLSRLTCESSSFQECIPVKDTDSLSEYKLYNFWIFALLSVISGCGASTLFCLTDAACNEVLGDNSSEYGRQRLWATISWGITTLVSGYLNDIFTGNSKHTNYSPGFYLMLTFVAVDIMVLSRIELKKAHISTNICKDVKMIFVSLKTIILSLVVYICGALSGLLWTYHFWFLTELGASQLLLGLVAGVQCLLTEVPFFFFSGWLIKKFGHFYCLMASLSAFALRTGLYSVLQNPWLVLPIELLHGITFALFYAAMTLYAVDCAPPGTEATMLGILGGVFEGLGVATGSFFGGIGFDNIGSRWTFFVASMISLFCVPLFIIAYKILPKSEGSLNLEAISNNCTKQDPNYGSDKTEEIK